MNINGYKAVNLETGEEYFAPNISKLVQMTSISICTIRRALKSNGLCRRGKHWTEEFRVSVCQQASKNFINTSDWLMSHLDGVNKCEVIEKTGGKTFALYGFYKEIEADHPLAKKSVIADYINSRGVRTLVV